MTFILAELCVTEAEVKLKVWMCGLTVCVYVCLQSNRPSPRRSRRSCSVPASTCAPRRSCSTWAATRPAPSTLRPPTSSLTSTRWQQRCCRVRSVLARLPVSSSSRHHHNSNRWRTKRRRRRKWLFQPTASTSLTERPLRLACCHQGPARAIAGTVCQSSSGRTPHTAASRVAATPTQTAAMAVSWRRAR